MCVCVCVFIFTRVSRVRRSVLLFNHQLLLSLRLCWDSQDKVAMDLGFYYMANAMGRLVGVLLGGFLYHYTVSLRTIAPPPASVWSCVVSGGGVDGSIYAMVDHYSVASAI